MPRHKPASASHDFLRRSIAGAAARLMAEDGISDYGTAKRKAARSLGAEDQALPSNEEVEVELRAWQALYQEDEQRQRLLDMRRAALDVMAVFEPFRPCLTGAVLDGTAGRFSAIELDIFADSAKDVEIYMLSRDISYETADDGQVATHAAHLAEAHLRLDWEDIPVRLAVYPWAAERSHRPGGHAGRARPAAVARLLSAMTAELAAERSPEEGRE